MTGVGRSYTDITRVSSAKFKKVDPRQGVYAKAVLKENAKFMLVMDDLNGLSRDNRVRRAYSAAPGKRKGVRPMHLSTLSLQHDSPECQLISPSYSRHFRSRRDLKPVVRPNNYPSQFNSQIVLEHDNSAVKDSTCTTNKTTFQSWENSVVRVASRESGYLMFSRYPDNQARIWDPG
eukprot:sb/3471874/